MKAALAPPGELGSSCVVSSSLEATEVRESSAVLPAENHGTPDHTYSWLCSNNQATCRGYARAHTREDNGSSLAPGTSAIRQIDPRAVPYRGLTGADLDKELQGCGLAGDALASLSWLDSAAAEWQPYEISVPVCTERTHSIVCGCYLGRVAARRKAFAGLLALTSLEAFHQKRSEEHGCPVARLLLLVPTPGQPHDKTVNMVWIEPRAIVLKMSHCRSVTLMHMHALPRS